MVISSSEQGSIGGRARAGALPVREQLVAAIAGTAPAMRRLFDVRPSPKERATWRSLTVHQLEALAELEQGSLTMGELCQRLGISESAGTALSDRLVAREMVIRESDEQDRRVVRLSLSKRARAMVERFQALKRQRIAEVLEALSDDELAALVGIHGRLLAGSSPSPCDARDMVDAGTKR